MLCRLVGSAIVGAKALAVLILAVAAGASLAGVALAAEPPAIDYARDIQPLLAQRCLGCHGPDKQHSNLRVDQRASLLRGGDFGEPAIALGKGSESHLVQLVRGDDDSLVMPPEGERLSAVDIDKLIRWIDAGAPMPGAAPNADDGPIDLTPQTDHWSFQPVRRAPPPQLRDDWIATPIDAFILAPLRERGLTPSAPADRRTLLRRLSLDLTGLAPTPDEVEAFAADERPEAYLEQVDRLLASPAYGERWGRHWLDVIRFAESDGFETNHDRPRAWRFRDWVIAAFNSDLPYDQFVQAQLAGDATGQPLGTGFLVGGPTDIVKSPDPVLTAMQRQDELADMVNTTSTAFLGVTIGCARCHHHKFDPVLMHDYYRFQAVLAGVRHGERPVEPVDFAQRRQRADDIDAQLAVLQRDAAQRWPQRTQPGLIFLDEHDGSRVDFLQPSSGKGQNPAGQARGQRDDPGAAGRTPNVSGGAYAWWQEPQGDVLRYRPSAAGRYRVWLSWGCGWHTHATAAEYLLDDDGDPATRDDQRPLATVDQQRFGDGSGDPVSQPLWSGFHNAGVHEFRPTTAIVLRVPPGVGVATADCIVLEPLDELERPAPPLRPPVSSRTNEERFAPIEARRVRFTIFATNSSEPCLDELEIWTAEPQPRNVALAAGGAKATSSGNYVGNPKHRLEHIHDGRYGNDYSWISNTDGAGWVTIELPASATIDRVVWGRDRQEQYQDRTATRYQIEVALADDDWLVVASSADRAPPGSTPSTPPAPPLMWLLAQLAPGEAADAARLLSDVAALQNERSELLVQTVAYVGSFQQPPTIHRLHRGDPMQPREPIAPGALAVLREPLGELDLPRDDSERDRRLALARWITAPEHPLTARVMVNRLWHYHFGRGLVNTPSDFGAMGARPTHPELLDWLAARLIDGGWSLKQVQRLIVASSVYQQASTPRDDCLAVDADAALLWRFPPRRLEAEAIRDNVLQASGVLDRSQGGPGYLLFQPNNNYARNWIAKDEFGPAEYRRMVYATKLRMELDAVFGPFDCPDAGQPTPQRSQSTTPVQALSLLHSQFIVAQAELLAARIEREASAGVDAQVRRAFELVLQRPPDDAEFAAARAATTAHGLSTLCRALLNANEFLFLR